MAVWPDFRASAETHGHAAGMSDEDIEYAIALLTPGTSRYVLDDPGYYPGAPDDPRHRTPLARSWPDPPVLTRHPVALAANCYVINKANPRFTARQG